MFTFASVAVLALASSALADPSPLTPATSNEGGPCVISWSPDTTGKWTDTNIELMTGENQNMIHITTVVSGLDTTSAAATSYSWTCPEVTPNAAIYWYQFSHAEEPTNLIWTTRWAIADATGATTQPANAMQPDGSAVPWGTGNLVDASKAVAAPAYITGETSAGASNSSVTASGSVTGSTSAALTTPTTMSALTTSSASSTPKTTIVTVTSSSSSASSSPTTSAKSGAERVKSHGAAFALGTVALGALLFA